MLAELFALVVIFYIYIYTHTAHMQTVVYAFGLVRLALMQETLLSSLNFILAYLFCGQWAAAVSLSL
jgi:hypothetical protein